MFTQKEDHLQEGNMLIHSWYCLGRGTPHQPGSGVTCFPRGMEWRTGGKLQKACPPSTPAWKPWNLKSSVVPTRIPLRQKLTEGSVLTFQFITLFQGQGALDPISPLPGRRAGNSHPTLLIMFATNWTSSVFPHQSPGVTKRAQKGCLKSWGSSQAGDIFVVVAVPLLSHVQLFTTPWTAARQVSLSFTSSWSLLKHVHWVSDSIQPSHPLSSPSPPAFNLSQHQGLF